MGIWGIYKCIRREYGAYIRVYGAFIRVYRAYIKVNGGYNGKLINCF